MQSNQENFRGTDFLFKFLQSSIQQISLISFNPVGARSCFGLRHCICTLCLACVVNFGAQLKFVVGLQTVVRKIAKRTKGSLCLALISLSRVPGVSQAGTAILFAWT